LFVEELTRSVLEAARLDRLQEQDPLTIPNTLQESLAARFQHLGPQIVAAARSDDQPEFSLALLQASAGMPGTRVAALMDRSSIATCPPTRRRSAHGSGTR
jgi:hypothetical protein